MVNNKNPPPLFVFCHLCCATATQAERALGKQVFPPGQKMCYDNERKARPGKSGGDAIPPACLRGSQGHAGRKPRFSRCLVFEARQRKTRGFLPAHPHEPRRHRHRQVIGRRLRPGFPRLSFREKIPTWNWKHLPVLCLLPRCRMPQSREGAVTRCRCICVLLDMLQLQLNL